MSNRPIQVPTDESDRLSFSRNRSKRFAFRNAIVATLAGVLMLTCLPVSASAQGSLDAPNMSDEMLQLQVRMLENDLQEQRGIVANANKICVPVRDWDGQSLDTQAVLCYDKSTYVQGIIEKTYEGRRPSQEELQFFVRNGLGLSHLYKQQIAQVHIPKLEKELLAYKAELSRRSQDDGGSPANDTSGSSEIDYNNVDIFSSSGETATLTSNGTFDYNSVDIFSSSDDTPSGNTGTITGDINAVTEPWDTASTSLQECPYTNPDPSSYTHKIDSNGNPGDRTYLDCSYFKEGDLRTQIPYKDGKYEGIWLGNPP